MTDDDVVRIKTGVTANYEETIKIPRAEWEAMTGAERRAKLGEIRDDTAAVAEVDAWAYVEGED